VWGLKSGGQSYLTLPPHDRFPFFTTDHIHPLGNGSISGDNPSEPAFFVLGVYQLLFFSGQREDTEKARFLFAIRLNGERKKKRCCEEPQGC
jgi:hypothetical protein